MAPWRRKSRELLRSPSACPTSGRKFLSRLLSDAIDAPLRRRGIPSSHATERPPAVPPEKERVRKNGVVRSARYRGRSSRDGRKPMAGRETLGTDLAKLGAEFSRPGGHPFPHSRAPPRSGVNGPLSPAEIGHRDRKEDHLRSPTALPRARLASPRSRTAFTSAVAEGRPPLTPAKISHDVHARMRPDNKRDRASRPKRRPKGVVPVLRVARQRCHVVA